MTEQYPTDEELKKITDWPLPFELKDFHAFMDYVHELWAYADWGWKQEGDVYYISTAGWSGNESLIHAMLKNTMFWMLFWQQSRRGGHYIFYPSGTLEQ